MIVLTLRVLGAIILLLAPTAVWAINTGLDITRGAAGLPTLTAGEFVGRIVQVTLGILGVVAFIFFFYGGLLWMTSAGNEETVRKAKATLSTALVGLVIILASLAFVTFIINQIYGQKLVVPGA